MDSGKRFLSLMFVLGSLAALPAPGAPVKVWVLLKDKGPAAASLPAASRAFENLPLHAPYLEGLQAAGFACDARLKWQNRVSGRIEETLLGRLRALPYVAEVSSMPRKARTGPALPRSPFPWRPGALAKRAAEGIDYGAGRALMESLQVDRVHRWMDRSGMRPGGGVRIAVIDADFHLGSPIYDPIKDGGRIRDQWDFVDGDSSAADDELLGSHGAQCLSLIGGNLPGTLVGTSPEAEFLLYRAEDDAQERYVEEDYVAAAIERAVDSGAHVINISLGYRYEFTDGSPDVPYEQFDGRTRPSSLAALGAARRNVLVSVAVGNLPDSVPQLPSLSAPADADSILAVGIVDARRVKCGYSCTGPSADGRIKPDIVSMGLAGGGCQTTVANPASAQGGLAASGGTSFAAPVIAGIAALLRQVRPDLSAEDIRQALLRTADRADQPDSQRGYGLADPVAALGGFGVAILPPLFETGITRFYHQGGADAIMLPWDRGLARPELQVVDVNGRRIRVTASVSGAYLLLQPDRPLQTGVYITRIR